MPIELVAELATAHGGNVEVAADMIRMAADAGAHTIKLQSYSLQSINPKDPQAAWLKQAYLDDSAHIRLKAEADARGVQFLSTPFDKTSLTFLLGLGCKRFKVASSSSTETWWGGPGAWIVSWPWGRLSEQPVPHRLDVTAIPLYPTPLEAVGRAHMLNGWSDHCVGVSAALLAIGRDIRYLEVHLAAPEGRGRITAWDKTPAQIRQLRDAIDDFETIRTGVSQTFRERWTA